MMANKVVGVRNVLQAPLYARVRNSHKFPDAVRGHRIIRRADVRWLVQIETQLVEPGPEEPAVRSGAN